MPKFSVDLECESCQHNDDNVIVESDEAPTGDNPAINGEPGRECSSCNDTGAWLIVGWEEVADAAQDT